MKSALLALLTLLIALTFARAANTPPPTPKQPVTNTYFDTTVTDDYQWLENFDDPSVKAWNAAQNKFSRAYLNRLSARTKIAARLKQLYSAASPNYFGLQYRKGTIFASKFQPPAQQPWIITLTSPDNLAAEHVALDPNFIGAPGSTAIDFATASHDGKRLAVSQSLNGSEDGTLFIYDVNDIQPLPDKIPRAQYATAGGSVAWNADDRGIFYTRYPSPGDRPAEDMHFYQQVYFHRLGTPTDQDTYEIGKEFPRIAEIELDSSRDGRWVLAAVANGDSGEYAHYLRGLDGHWQQITKFSDEIKIAQFGDDDSLFLLSHANAPHDKILRLAPGITDLAKAKVVVPESDAVIQEFCPSASGVFTQDLAGGPSQIRFFDLTNATSKIVPIKPISSVQQILHMDGDRILFRNVTYIDPFVWMSYDNANGQTQPTALAGTSPADFSDMEVVREFATSRDGTKIPMNIIHHKKVKLDGTNPTLLYGYGGYSISLSPNFNVGRRVWFDQGGIYVVANLRGGGEYGEEWHKSGNLTKKQNVFDDFAACAEHLIRAGYTRPDKLAVEGASNGGLLMGAFLTQHPDLVRAVVSHVGIYDSLRSELEPNGAFNVTEFGTVKNKDQFDALYAYSPYHHVVDGAHYPAVLLMTGDHDGRVNPYHSRKMIARLQAANKSNNLILLRTTSAAGHGMGTAFDERVAEEADVWAFLFDQLGLKHPRL